MVIVLPLLTVSRFHIGCGGVRIFAAMVGILLNSCSRDRNSNDSRLSDLKDQFQLDWSTERKPCNSIHKAAWIFDFAEDALEQLRSTVRHSRLLADISRSGHRYAKPDNSLRRQHAAQSETSGAFLPQPWSWSLFRKCSSEQRREFPLKSRAEAMPPAWIRKL